MKMRKKFIYFLYLIDKLEKVAKKIKMKSFFCHNLEFILVSN